MPASTSEQVRESERRRAEKGETPIRSPTTWVEGKHAERAKAAGDAAWKAAVAPYKRDRGREM